MGHPGGGGRRPMLLAVLFTVLTPVLAFAAVRTAAYETTGFRADLSDALPPASAWPDLKRVMRDARKPRSALPKDAAAVAREGATAYPLAFEPFLIAGRVAELQGRYGEAIRLMEEARRRRPNYTPTRVHLLSYYSLSNAYQKAIDEADVAMRVNSNTSEYILPAFARLVAQDPKARAAIARALSRGPAWDRAFFQVAARAGMTPETASRLVADVRANSSGAGDRRAEDTFLVETLLNAGRFAAAREHWLRTLAGPADRAALLIDGDFRTGAAPPFGWRLEAGADGVAERAKGSGSEPPHLEVSYFGNAPAKLAEQLLVLSPGVYRLTALAHVQGGGEEEVALSFRLLCLPGEKVIATLPMPPAQARRPYAATFTVPAGCQAQRLVLNGSPADLPRTVSAQIFTVSLTRPGSAAR